MSLLERSAEMRWRVSELIKELREEHGEIRRQEWILKMLVTHGDYQFAQNRAAELQIFLGQHFLKEEAGLRYILAHGENRGPLQEKEVTERLLLKHRAMTFSFQRIPKIGALNTETERLTSFAAFEQGFLELLREEEEEMGINSVPNPKSNSLLEVTSDLS